jgi:hypothetical protein
MSIISQKTKSPRIIDSTDVISRFIGTNEARLQPYVEDPFIIKLSCELGDYKKLLKLPYSNR